VKTEVTSDDEDSDDFFSGAKPSNNKRAAVKKTKKQDVKEEKSMTVVEIDGKEAFQCAICQKSFMKRRALKTHIQIHKDEKSICCTTCGAM
jgi:hypothetical protein